MTHRLFSVCQYRFRIRFSAKWLSIISRVPLSIEETWVRTMRLVKSGVAIEQHKIIKVTYVYCKEPNAMPCNFTCCLTKYACMIYCAGRTRTSRSRSSDAVKHWSHETSRSRCLPAAAYNCSVTQTCQYPPMVSSRFDQPRVWRLACKMKLLNPRLWFQ